MVNMRVCVGVVLWRGWVTEKFGGGISLFLSVTTKGATEIRHFHKCDVILPKACRLRRLLFCTCVQDGSSPSCTGTSCSCKTDFWNESYEIYSAMLMFMRLLSARLKCLEISYALNRLDFEQPGWCSKHSGLHFPLSYLTIRDFRNSPL